MFADRSIEIIYVISNLRWMQADAHHPKPLKFNKTRIASFIAVKKRHNISNNTYVTRAPKTIFNIPWINYFAKQHLRRWRHRVRFQHCFDCKNMKFKLKFNKFHAYHVMLRWFCYIVSNHIPAKTQFKRNDCNVISLGFHCIPHSSVNGLHSIKF